MDEYISREALIEEISSLSVTLCGNEIFGILAKHSVVKMICEQPAADVVEVRHGEWIYHDCVSSYDGAVSGYSCSECNIFVREEMFEEFEDFYKDYCGHCGAKMDGKRKDGAE